MSLGMTSSGPLRTMEGHDGFVFSVAVTPDGKHAVSGSEDTTVRLWDLSTGQCLRTMKGHRLRVGSVTVTPDGKHAVSGSWDETVCLWDLSTGQCSHTMEGHRKGVWSVAVTPDGKMAVSAGSFDKTLCLWDLSTGQCLRTMEGHREGVNSVAMTPGGRHAVSGSRDKTVRLWDLFSVESPKPAAGPAPVSPAPEPLPQMSDKEMLVRLEKMFKASKRLKIDDVAAILKVARPDLMGKLFDWSERFGIKVDGDFIVIGEDVDFMSALDQQFAAWGDSESSKHGKI